MIIKVNVDKLIVSPIQNRLVIGGSDNFVFAEFRFDGDWEGLAKTVTFYSGSTAYDVLLEDDVCEIPHELLIGGNEIHITVSGYGDKTVRTKKTISGIKVYEEGTHQGTTPGAYTPELWEQVIAVLDTKQDQLIAGSNITLEETEEGTVISSRGGSGGTSDYEDLDNLPEINGVTLIGDKSLDDLGSIKTYVVDLTASDIKPVLNAIYEDTGKYAVEIKTSSGRFSADALRTGSKIAVRSLAYFAETKRFDNIEITYTHNSSTEPTITTTDTISSEAVVYGNVTLDVELATLEEDKQDKITDLDTIRTGAALGATALQEVPATYRTAAAQDEIDNAKQSKTIADEGDYFTTDTVEGALQELGAGLNGVDTALSGILTLVGGGN